jgi:hypothetical protein
MSLELILYQLKCIGDALIVDDLLILFCSLELEEKLILMLTMLEKDIKVSLLDNGF